MKRKETHTHTYIHTHLTGLCSVVMCPSNHLAPWKHAAVYICLFTSISICFHLISSQMLPRVFFVIWVTGYYFIECVHTHTHTHTFNSPLLLDFWKRLNDFACSFLFSGIVSLGQILETENRLPFFSWCLCHVGFPKMNGNATFSWEWVITRFPLISSTKQQIHPKLMPSRRRTAGCLPTTPSSESVGINFPFSSFLYIALDPFFL